MTDLRTIRPDSRDWRAYLTADERREIVRLEKIIAQADKMAREPRSVRAKIQNRAAVRAGRK